jgi:N-acetylglutamate synthase-like GNAT family acetyltransferase
MSKIRLATLKDLPQIQALNLKLFKYERQFSNSYSLSWTFSDIGTAYFTKRITAENGIVFVSEHQQSLNGYICGYTFTHPARNPSAFAEIDNMFVEEHVRHQQIGSKLIKAFETKAHHQGVKIIKVGALFPNTHSHHFYSHHQFHSHEIIFEKHL